MNVNVAGATLLLIVVKVLLPLTVKAPAPPLFRIGYVAPPPANVLAEAEVMLMVPVPVTVKLVLIAQLHAAAPEPVIVQVPDPMPRVLTLLLDEANVPVETLFVPAFKVP